MNQISTIAPNYDVPVVALRRFGFLAYCNGYTAWAYRCWGPLREVLTPGYFADTDTQDVRAGDTIHIHANDGIAIFGVAMHNGVPVMTKVITDPAEIGMTAGPSRGVSVVDDECADLRAFKL